MHLSHSLTLAGLTTLARAIDLNVNSTDSLLNASSIIVQEILQIYKSPETLIPGLFPDDYYWWESRLAFDSLVKYHSLSADDSVVPIVQEALLWQSNCPDCDYMPANQTKSIGNSDQAFWGLAAMTAAETGFPQQDGQNVTWLQLAQNVFNTQVVRWNEASCGGGFKWQIYSFDNGYNYKNSASQATFAQLAARLARYTGNTTYSDWAEKVTQWSMSIGLISDQYAVYDGTDDTTNCSTINKLEYTEDIGLFIGAAAYGQNESLAHDHSSDTLWYTLLGQLVATTQKTFTTNQSILYEPACSNGGKCMIDQLAFRAPLARALANARDLTNLDTHQKEIINQILQASAQAAAAQCSGQGNQMACGNDWTTAEWDGTQGLGQDLSALEVIMANLPAKQMDSVNANGTANGTQTSTGTTASPTITGGAANLVPSLRPGSFVFAGLIAGFAVML